MCAKESRGSSALTSLALISLVLPLLACDPPTEQDRPGENRERGRAADRPGEFTPVRATQLFADHELTLLILDEQRQNRAVRLQAQNGDLAAWVERERGPLPSECQDGVLVAGRVTSHARDDVLCLGGEEGQRPVLVLLGTSLRYPITARASFLLRSAAVTTADLDQALDEAGQPHEEVLLAYHRQDGIHLEILDWKFGPLLQQRVASSADGDLVLGSGDFDLDGSPEVVLGYGREALAAAAGQKQFTVETFRIDNTVAGDWELTPGDAYELEVEEGIYGLGLATGDFDGSGDDEFALAYYDGSRGLGVVVDVFDADTALQISRTASEVVDDDRQRFFQIARIGLAAGLFKLDPGNGYMPWRRQLVVGSNKHKEDTVGTTRLAIVDIGDDLTRLAVLSRQSHDFVITLPPVFPSLAAGNFRGVADLDRATWQVAVLHQRFAGVHLPSEPALVSFDVSQSGILRRAGRIFFPDHRGPSGTYGRIVAHDPEGRSVRFGTPAHLTVEDFISLEYVIGEPPKHVDYLPEGPRDPESRRSVFSVSGSPDFFVRLADDNETRVTAVQESTTSASIGSSSSESIRGSVTANVFFVETEFSHEVKNTVTAEYREARSELEENFTEFEWRESRTTHFDDALSYNSRLIDVWRFPLRGLQVDDAERPHAYFEIAVPGPLLSNRISGRDADWYQPRHANNNALSYTPFSGSRLPEDFPPDLGAFRVEGRPDPIVQTLNDLAVSFSWSGTAETLDIRWTQGAGESQRKEFASRFSHDRVVSTAASAKVSYGTKASAGVELETIYRTTEESNLARSEVASVTMQESRGITIEIPADGRTGLGYAFKPAAYVADSGAFKVAHATNLQSSASGRRWWQEHYAGRPDPGLNLPNRFEYSGGSWTLAREPFYSQMRGVFLRDLEDGSHLGRGLIDGDRVRLSVRIYNYSLDRAAAGVPVSLRYQEVSSNLEPIAEPREIGRATVDLDPRSLREASVVWNTASLGGPGDSARYYILRVEIDPDDVIRDEIHEGRDARGEPLPGSNNHGYYPWSSAVKVFGRGTRPVLSAANDMAIATDGLLLEAADGRRLQDRPKVVAGHCYRLRATVRSEVTDARYRHVVFRQQGPGKKGAREDVIAHRVVRGMAAGANTISAWWEPGEAGAAELLVELLEDSRDARPGNARASLAVEIVAPTESDAAIGGISRCPVRGT